ncbi:late competence development ComFB family protein [Desulfonispora thiosulfatigenes]|nr:late competence development ComFB family protein [Desulfonispora thiosulfatigenes]
MKNYMEDVVEEILTRVLKEYKDICKCEKCIEDVKALTLNKFYPLYVVTEQGNTYAKLHELEMQFHTDILKEIIKSIEIICKNPRHLKS